MITETLKLVKIHENTHLIEQCIEILNEEWPRESKQRMKTMKRSSDNFPICLALIDDQQQNQEKVIGFVKLTSEKPFNPVIFVESLIVSKEYRRKGIGRFIMEQVEKFAKELNFEKIHLTTTDQQEFYLKLGYLLPKCNNNNGNKILMYKHIL